MALDIIIKSFFIFFVCHKDMDEMRWVCDGLLKSTVLSGITGGIVHLITLPAHYNNEDIYENKNIFVVMARSSDFWDRVRIAAAYNINY